MITSLFSALAIFSSSILQPWNQQNPAASPPGVMQADEAPPLPPVVKAAIVAADAIAGAPYKTGGGHRVLDDEGFDCSGTVSYVLRHAGLLKGALDSPAFGTWGESGPGGWITVYVKPGHVFMSIGGRMLDTTSDGRSRGPRWRTASRPDLDQFITRHPAGL